MAAGAAETAESIDSVTDYSTLVFAFICARYVLAEPSRVIWFIQSANRGVCIGFDRTRRAGNMQEVNEGRRKSLQGTCCVHSSACKMQLAAGRCVSSA